MWSSQEEVGVEVDLEVIIIYVCYNEVLGIHETIYREHENVQDKDRTLGNMTSKRWFEKGESERKSENKFWKVGGHPGGVGDLLILR